MDKKLINAVKRQLGSEWKTDLEDVCRSGASAGYGGFIYYSDTISFFRRNRAEIVELVKEMAGDFGVNMLEFVAEFNCLKDFDYTDEIGRALWGKLQSDDVQVPNALAWFALEEVARFVCDE